MKILTTTNMPKSRKEIAKQIATLKKEYQTVAKDAFHNEAKELFAKYPRLKSFGCNAFSPYFNDGDECVYRVDTDTPIINGYQEWDEEETDNKLENLIALGEDEYYDEAQNKFVKKPKEQQDPEAGEIVQAVMEFLSSFDDDYYMEAFGNHVTVHITAKKVSTDEYNHD